MTNGLEHRDPDYERNELDVNIFKNSFRHYFIIKVGLCSLPLNEAIELATKEIESIAKEASKFPTFDDYWKSF